MNGSNGKVNPVGIIIVAILVVGAIIYALQQKPSTPEPQPEPASETDSEMSSEPRKNNLYCTNYEGICFEYPRGWSISESRRYSRRSVSVADQLTVLNANKQPVLYLTTGITDVESSCSARSTVSLETIETTPTRLAGYDEPEDKTDTDVAHMVKAVGVTDKDKFMALMYLTIRADQTKTGVVSDCLSVGRMTIRGKETGDTNALVGRTEPIMFSTVKYGTLKSYAFKSKADALAQLRSSDYKKAAGILQSVYYQ